MRLIAPITQREGPLAGPVLQSRRAGGQVSLAAQRRLRQACQAPGGAHQGRQNARPVYPVPGYCLD
jgi:hypothetical protein